MERSPELEAASLFQPLLASHAHLSPSGTHVALRITDPLTGNGGITIINFARRSATGLRPSKDYTIRWVRWVGDDALVYAATSPRRFDAFSDGQPTTNSGLYAIPRQDPTAITTLSSRLPRRSDSITPPSTDSMDEPPITINHTTHRFTVWLNESERADFATRSGLYEFEFAVGQKITVRRIRELASPPQRPLRWFVDREGAIRYAWGRTKSGPFLYRLAGSTWAPVTTFDTAFTPVALADDNSKLLGYHRTGEHLNTPAQLDLTTGNIFLTTFSSSMSMEASSLVVGSIDRAALNPNYRNVELPDPIRAALPSDAANYVIDRSADKQQLLVCSQDPQGAAALYLCNSAAGTTQRIFNLTPWFDNAPQVTIRRTIFSVPGNTGLSASATTPISAKAKPPLVVLLSNATSPQPSDYAPEVRFFASCGYVVLAPLSFQLHRHKRGDLPKSADFLSLRDQVLRLVRAFVTQGTIDPARVFIVGEGSSGWLAASCASEAPDLFRAATILQCTVPPLILDSPTPSSDLDQRREAMEREVPLPASASIRVPLLLGRVTTRLSRRPVMIQWESSLAQTAETPRESFAIASSLAESVFPTWRDRATLYLRTEAFLKKHL